MATEVISRTQAEFESIKHLGGDEESTELRGLAIDVIQNPDDFEAWEKLVRSAESLEGGLNRNSSPQAIAATREIYDRFLAAFPLFFGYWRKYADLEFSIAGTEAAEMVYERGVASVSNSADLWTSYCGFKVDTCHDSELIRELFERGAESVGLDFLSHPFWDKYIDFEERLDAPDRIFAILRRIADIPMHQYHRYFERFRQMSHARPIAELAPPDMLSQFRRDLEMAAGSRPLSDQDLDRELRGKVDEYYLSIFHRTQTETTKRWTYEQEIKRPYFHVTDLADAELTNWRKYLDFEEAEGDYKRIVFLYERCVVTAAYYEEFWMRYARWMIAQHGKQEEVRNIYQRASCFYVAISKPAVRIQYALFEEMEDRPDVAEGIYQAILITLPGHIETVEAWANLQRRQVGLDAAIAVFKGQLQSNEIDTQVKGALVASWARLLWKIKRAPAEARQVYQDHQQYYLDVRPFWYSYLMFEIAQPTTADSEAQQHGRIRQVLQDVRRRSRLLSPAIKELSHCYMAYLLERGQKDTAKEYMMLDKEINGPPSVQAIGPGKAKLSEYGETNDAAHSNGVHYQQQMDYAIGANGSYPTS